MKEMKSFATQSGSTDAAQHPRQMLDTAGLSKTEMERRREAEKKWEKADISNDFIFYKVMTENYDLCLKLAQIILPDLNITELKYANAQETVKESHDAKGVCLDIFVKDGFGRVIDIEMQVVSAKNLPKRSRYYQSAVDMTMLKAGESYSKLKCSYIIFICLDDPFELNRKIYTFGDACYEVPELKLNSGALKIFLNASGIAGEINGELDQFLKYVNGEDIDNPADFIDRFQNAVFLGKQNSEWRREFMIATMRDLEKIEEGREEGREEGIMLMAFRFASSKLKQGVQEDVIINEMVSFLSLDKNIARTTLEKAKSKNNKADMTS